MRSSAKALVIEALEPARAANRELRELAHGLLSDVLTRGGLAAGVESIVLGLHVPVDVSVPEDRFPAEIEASAYFVVAEALTNMVKHSNAQHANVAMRLENGRPRGEQSAGRWYANRRRAARAGTSDHANCVTTHHTKRQDHRAMDLFPFTRDTSTMANTSHTHPFQEGDYLTDRRRLYRVLAIVPAKLRKRAAILEDCETLDATLFLPRELKRMRLQLVPRAPAPSPQ